MGEFILVINLKRLVISLLVPLAVGGVAGIITGGSSDVYSQFVKPPLSPPGWVFPVVWTILYICMGLAFYFVWQSDAPSKSTAMQLYFIQLAMNFVWFFRFGAYGFSFVWLLVLWILILFTVFAFYAADKKAGYLMIPYLLWVAFAGYLNLGVYILN